MCLGHQKKTWLWQQKPEGTSSAMFDVGTAAKCCEFKRYVLGLDSMLRELLSCDKNTSVFPGKMFSDRGKNYGCGQKKKEGTSSAMFGVEPGAKCCELKRYADRVRSRTQKKKVLKKNFGL